jgi:hypothetical protein
MVDGLETKRIVCHNLVLPKLLVHAIFVPEVRALVEGGEYYFPLWGSA